MVAVRILGVLLPPLFDGYGAVCAAPADAGLMVDLEFAVTADLQREAASGADGCLVVVEGEYPVAFGLVPFGFADEPGQPSGFVVFSRVAWLPAVESFQTDAEPTADSQFPDESRVFEARSNAAFGSAASPLSFITVCTMMVSWPSVISSNDLRSSSAVKSCSGNGSPPT